MVAMQSSVLIRMFSEKNKKQASHLEKKRPNPSRALGKTFIVFFYYG
jgi:hypothetical protein